MQPSEWVLICVLVSAGICLAAIEVCHRYKRDENLMEQDDSETSEEEEEEEEEDEEETADIVFL